MLLLNTPGPDLVLALLNADNARSLTFAEVEFADPITTAEPAAMGRNTKLDVASLPGAPFFGTRTVYYWRLPIDQVMKPEYCTLNAELATNSTDLIPIINAKFGLALMPADIIAEPISISQLPFDYTLKIAPTSYAYTGQVALVLSDAIEDIITQPVLTGMTFPSDPVVMTGGAVHLEPEGDLYAGTGILGEYLRVAQSEELELILGAHRRGGRSGYPSHFMPDVDGNYQFSLVNDWFWNWSFSIGLLNTQRGSNIVEMYNVTMKVQHGDDFFVMRLLQAEVAGEQTLIWKINDTTVIQDSKPIGLNVTQNSQQTRWYTAGIPGLVKNGVGADLGIWTITLRAEPLGALYLPIVELATTVTVTAA